MEFILSRKQMIAVGIVLILLAFAAGGYFAWSRGAMLASLKFDTPSLSEPVFSAIDSMFTASVTSESAWERQVCAGMTVDGCKLFENMYGPAIWSAVSAGRLPKTTFTYAETVQKVSPTDEVWKLSTNNTAQPWFYIEVSQEPTMHQWLLVRILFDQEVQARYGSK